MGKLFEKNILRTIQKHTKERNSINASQFAFRADHNMTLQCMRLADHVTVNFKNNMSTAAVFLHIEKTFNTTWHSGLLHILLESEFLISLIKLICSFLTDRIFKFLVEGEFSMEREMAAGVPQGSIFAPILYNLCIKDNPKAPGTHLVLFMDNTCIYISEKHERSVLCKLKHGLTVAKSSCEHWNIKSKGKTHAMYISRRLRVPKDVLQLNGMDIPFVNNVTCLGVTFNRRITW
jgi:hypothetical protein